MTSEETQPSKSVRAVARLARPRRKERATGFIFGSERVTGVNLTSEQLRRRIKIKGELESPKGKLFVEAGISPTLFRRYGSLGPPKSASGSTGLC